MADRIGFSQLIAGQLARLRAVPDWSPALLDTWLRTSKWFLVNSTALARSFAAQLADFRQQARVGGLINEYRLVA
jgi:hypothetical protein